jgi:hypothetical protein
MVDYSSPRFARIPTAVERNGVSRSKLYEFAGNNPGLFRKIDQMVFVDLHKLDNIIASAPVEVPPPKKK